jgi:hypothetical protein
VSHAVENPQPVLDGALLGGDHPPAPAVQGVSVGETQGGHRPTPSGVRSAPRARGCIGTTFLRPSTPLAPPARRGQRYLGRLQVGPPNTGGEHQAGHEDEVHTQDPRPVGDG